MNNFYKINSDDNVAIALKDIKKGYTENGITAIENIPFGHKILLKDLKSNDNIIKYGYPIGHLTNDAKKGCHIHEHNLKTNLSNKLEYKFEGDNNYAPSESKLTINAYKRKNGKIGIRNEIWIIPTVGCVNKTAQALEKIGKQVVGEKCDGVFAYTHPYGCSQMDEDQETTRKALASLINHPNAGGVLIVSLGCENTNINSLKKYIDDFDSERIETLVCQEVDDEIEIGKQLIKRIYNRIKNSKREKVNINELKIGFKCGGSDAFSGITANPLCGVINDKLTNLGATTILTEVPEMFGAEHILMKRSQNINVFEKQVAMINGYKDYFAIHNKECYENPSPGNHEGGITTLEEKSLGCVQKGGKSIITDVLQYGQFANKAGINLLTGPGNDIVSTTNLTCAGAHIILFTTGRGTSLGAPVPTIKIASNTPLFNKKKNWIDFNAGDLINANNINDMSDDLFNLTIDIANGKKTKNEINEYRDIAIFKDGVIM